MKVRGRLVNMCVAITTQCQIRQFGHAIGREGVRTEREDGFPVKRVVSESSDERRQSARASQRFYAPA